MSNETIKVTIQGIAGCFHDAAARKYFSSPDVKVLPVACETFPDMFDTLKADASLLGIVAIENTIAGSLLANHELIRNSSHVIVGEQKMRICHCLAALPGQKIEDIREVRSHPMALRQCDNFIRSHRGLRAIESYDTAGAAEEIAHGQLYGQAAVCSELAAQLYGLEILAEGIETNKKNFTRFLILADPLEAPNYRPDDNKLDKSTLVFTLPHSQGALSKVLTIFSFYDLNLSKIQSMPIVGREWEYRFYVDLTFDSLARYRQALDAVRPLTSDLRILGEYVDTVHIPSSNE